MKKLYTDDELWERKKSLNAKFQWSPENVQKLLALNDKLFALMNELYDVEVKMARDLDGLIAQGKDYYKKYDIDGKLSYEGELPNMDWVLQDAISNKIVWEISNADPSSRQRKLMSDLNWNVGIFDRPEFKNHYICYMMHALFHDGYFALEDGCAMELGEWFYFVGIHV